MLFTMQSTCSNANDRAIGNCPAILEPGKLASKPAHAKSNRRRKPSSLDTLSTTESIVDICVKTRSELVERSPTFSSGSKSKAQRRERNKATASNSRSHSRLSVNSIPCTLPAAGSDSSNCLLKSTALTANNLPIWKGSEQAVTDCASTGSKESKSPEKVEATEADRNRGTDKKLSTSVKRSVKFEGKAGDSTKPEDSVQTPINLERSKQIFETRKATICRTDKSVINSRIDETAELTESQSAFRRKSANSCNQRQNPKRQSTGPNEFKPLFVKSEVPSSSRARSDYLRQRSAAGSKSLQKYRSAVDLRQQHVYRHENPSSEERNSSTASFQNAQKASAANLEHYRREFTKSLASSQDKVTSEKKWLSKSLSNLTADDVLSAPCSTIFVRKELSTSLLRITASNQQLNQRKRESKEEQQIDIAQVKQQLGKKDMSRPGKFFRSRQSTANGKLQKAADDDVNEKDVDAKSVKAKSEASVNAKTNEIATGKKSASSAIEAEKKREEKAKKAPRLTKSLFPFMRKSRKHQNPPQAEQSKPMKVQEQAAPIYTDTNANNSKVMDTDTTTPDPQLHNDRTHSFSDVGGFKKLKVPSQSQRDFHSTYATRVAKVRSEGTANSTSSGSSETSPKSELGSNSPSDPNSTLKSMLVKDVKIILRNKINSKLSGSRRSADLSSSPSNGSKKTWGRRHSSLAVPAADQIRRDTDYSRSSFAFNCFSSTDDLNSAPEPYEKKSPNGSSNQRADSIFRDSPSAKHEHNKLVPGCEGALKIKPLLPNDEDPLSERCSIDLAAMETQSGSSPSEENASEKRSSVDSFDRAGIMHSAIPGSRTSMLRASLASSFGSLFEEEEEDGESPDKSGTAEEEEESAFRAQVRHIRSKSAVLVQRSKSLCRQRTVPSNLQSDGFERKRSVSPSFGEARFNSAVSQPNVAHHKTTSVPCTRHSSFKDVASQMRPIKPTTPKPRKMSSASSFTALNKFNFQASTAPPNDSFKPDEENPDSSTKEVTLRNLEGRNRASAKNAQIRRRMSLQPNKPARYAELTEERRRIQEFEDLKRNSMPAFDLEKVKSAMAKWSSASSSGSNGVGSRRTRRRARPLSEVPNLRWDVHSIPEHKEVSSIPLRERTPAVDVEHSSSPSGGHIETAGPRSDLDDCLAALVDDAATDDCKRTLGTCFSEEDIPSARDEEFAIGTNLPRSLSLLEGMDSLAKNVSIFVNRSKKCWDNIRVPYSSNMVADPSSLNQFGFPIHERKCVQGSTVSGISNESGYGSMSRRSAHLRPSETEDEDVFHAHTNRLSNEDFPTEDGLFVEALWDHVTMDDDELGFKVGDVIRVIDMTDADWWWGALESKEGWFPATFVRILVNQHREYMEQGDADGAPDDEDDPYESSRVTDFDRTDDPTCRCGKRFSASSVHCSNCGRPWKGVDVHSSGQRKYSSSKHPQIVVTAPSRTRKTSVTRDHVRKNVINEIVNSEKGFVGHLKDVIEGYLTRCRKRPDMFTEKQLSIIFSNIEEIYEFQRHFAADLEAALNRSSVHLTELGNVFLKHKSGFKIYSEYCNNHPQALALLSQLFSSKKYIQFFEACRLLQMMIDISLDGFLLTPVQKICKYPLQLAELLKYTSADHPDYQPVKSALVAMKGVAKMINERKRMLENIRKISIWQSSVLNWQGEDVLAASNELVHSGEVTASKQSKGKPKPRMAFLFDHQLILCKKDLLRKDLLCYKKRLDLDRHVMIPMEGCSPRSSTNLSGDWSSSGSSSGQCGWILTDKATGESTVFYCKSDDYDKWMKSFPLEREIALSRNDFELDHREELTKDLLKSTIVLPRKPKDSSAVRGSTRSRIKMAQEANFSKQKLANVGLVEKGSGGFFSSVAGKLTPFRRATTREMSAVH